MLCLYLILYVVFAFDVMLMLSVFNVAAHVVVEYYVGNLVPAFLGSRAVWCGVFVHVVCCACRMLSLCLMLLCM